MSIYSIYTIRTLSLVVPERQKPAEAELNPKADTFCDLLWAIEAVGSIDITARRWQPVKEPLESFFS
jgi:hypothetical protein